MKRIAGGIVALVVGVSALAGDKAVAPRLNGTFIQLLAEHGKWTEAQWETLFQSLKSIGIADLIVQWSVLDNSACYQSKTLPSIPNAPLEKLMAEADRNGMKVLVGLVHDSSYWSSIEKGSASVYLSGLRTRSLAVAGELAPMMKKHLSFQGWYIPEEIDDVNWRTPEARQVLFDHLAALSRELHRLTPRATIGLSAFAQAQESPEEYGRFWDELFRSTSVSLLLFQDGLGANKLELEELPIYLAPLKDAAEKEKRTLRVVVELFRQVSGPPIDNAAFHAVPGPLPRIESQLALAAGYSDGGIVGFSVPEYMSPLGGAAAQELLASYRATISSNNAKAVK